MQLSTGLVLVAGLALAFASPVNKKATGDEGEVVIVPLDSAVLMEDADVGFPGGFYSFNPFANPFSGFLQSMDDMLKNLRDQMSQVLQRLPPDSGEWSEIGNGKGNTTSTTKIINGHKVTVNETTYSNQGENSGSIFKIRIVDVHPTSEEETEVSNEKPLIDTKVKDVEEVTTKRSQTLDKGSPEIEESSANEIPQGAPEIDNSFEDNIETQREDTVLEGLPSEPFPTTLFNAEIVAESDDNFIPPLPEIETNDVNVYPYDLSKDTHVNQMLADAGAPQNPDAEIITPNGRVFDLWRDTLINQNYSPTVDVMQGDEGKPDVEVLQKFEKMIVPSVDNVK